VRTEYRGAEIDAESDPESGLDCRDAEEEVMNNFFRVLISSMIVSEMGCAANLLT
jgi:hypothetical protein